MFFLVIMKRILCEVGSDILRISAWLINQAIPVAVRSKTCVFGRRLAGVVGSNPAGRMDDCLSWLLYVLFGRGFCDGPSLVQEGRTECGASECDFETLTVRRP